jgi:putative transposase
VQARKAKPSRVAVDNQSVKTRTLISLNTGIDGNKNINGRKRHLAVDVLGLPMAMYVSSANVHDTAAGIELLWQLDEASDRLKLICGD